MNHNTLTHLCNAKNFFPCHIVKKKGLNFIFHEIKASGVPVSKYYELFCSAAENAPTVSSILLFKLHFFQAISIFFNHGFRNLTHDHVI